MGSGEKLRYNVVFTRSTNMNSAKGNMYISDFTIQFEAVKIKKKYLGVEI